MTTDGSSHAYTAINIAALLLRKDDLEVDVLCVAPEPVVSGTRERLMETHRERVARRTRWITNGAEEILRRQGVKASSRIETGSPSDEILKAASDYDLIVVGAHGKFDRKQPGLGPVSSQILSAARAPVMVGRDLLSEGNYRILVALDGSEAGFEALRSLRSYFDLSSLDVTLMHVMETPWTRLGLEDWSEDESETPGVKGYQHEFRNELRREAEEIIDRGLRQIEKWGVPVTTVIEEGDPAQEIVNQADAGSYDLIVAGAVGVSDMKHALLGSVSHKIAWNASCSVLINR
jgi:nucleotide-binding universal stress UspA family protein